MIKTGVNFKHLHRDNYKSIVLWGGRGSGKSHDTIDYFIKHNLNQPFNSVVTRRYDRHVRATYDYFKSRLVDYPPRIFDVLKLTSSPMRIINRVNGAIIFFEGLDNPDNSIKGIPKLNLAWLEEASEGDRERYMTLYNTVRDGENTHVISTFNPVSANNWTKRFFFEEGFHSSNYHTTVEDNPFISGDYKRELRDLKNVDRLRYEVDYLGMWGVLTELTYFKNVELVNHLPGEAALIGAGLDFGISDPTVLCKTYVHDGYLYIEIVINARELPTTSPTGYSLKDEIKRLKIPITIQADPEDKTSIYTLKAHGIDIIPALKGKGSIIGGIKKIQQFKGVRIINNEHGESAYSDFRNYHRKKRPDGIILEDPETGQEDHTTDAARYSMSRTIFEWD